jgi:peptidoglycan/LPS O-acetylase OafA/YrhL
MVFGALVYTEQQGPGLQIGFWFTRSFPPWRLPVFVMGCCCAWQVVQQRKQEQSGCLQPNQNGEFLGSKVVASCGCLHPSTGLLFWFLGACASCSVLVRIAFSTFGSEVAIGFHFATKMILEMSLPILFYDWILSLTDNDAKINSVVARVFSMPPFAFLADISMSLYLIHFFVVILVSYSANDGAYLGMPWWGICVAFPVSILLGWSMTRFVEKPLQRAVRGDAGKGVLVRSKLVGKASHEVGEPVQVLGNSSCDAVGSLNVTK